MKTETVKLWKNGSVESELTRYVRDDNDLRPAVLVIPGGGYAVVCEDTEGGPIARRFDKLGFHAFVLNYRVSPHRFPEHLQDAMRAMKIIRGRAAEWHVKPNNVAVCGFSAGGHLACSLGTISGKTSADDGDAYDKENPVPDAMLLAYAVITSGEYAHRGSVECCLGQTTPEKEELFSLEKQVTETTPPAFIWSTLEDSLVPYQNSMMFFNAMHEKHRIAELHVFPQGPHGMQLGYGRTDIAQWPEQAAAFLRNSCGFMPDPGEAKRTAVLTFDDASKTHLKNVVPLLKEFGFGATFFITRFNDSWRAAHEETLLTPEETGKLAEEGFEIGNHTWNHECGLEDKTEDEIKNEIISMEDYIVRRCGAPKPVSYAYPGGPYSAKTADVLKKLGYKYARIVENRCWNTKHDDPMKIPAASIRNNADWDFYHMTDNVKDGEIPVLVFHGVPDVVHGHVNTDVVEFKKFLNYLYGRGWKCVSLADAAKE